MHTHKFPISDPTHLLCTQKLIRHYQQYIDIQACFRAVLDEKFPFLLFCKDSNIDKGGDDDEDDDTTKVSHLTCAKFVSRLSANRKMLL